MRRLLENFIMDKSKIIKSTVIMTAVSIIGRIVSVPKNIVVGLAMPAADFGVYNSIFLWFFYLTILSSFTNGLFSTASRDSAHYFGIPKQEQQGIDIQNKSITVGSIIVLMILAGYFIYAFRKETPQLVSGFVLVGVFYLLNQISSLYERFNSARNLFTGVAVANLLNDAIVAVLVMAAVFSWGIYALFLGPIIALVVKILYFQAKMPLQFRPSLDHAVMKRYYSSALFFGATALISNLYSVVDRTFINLYLDSTVMGLYSFSLMSVMMLQTLFATFQGVFYDTINKSSTLDAGVTDKVMHYNFYFLFFTIFLIVISQFAYYVMVGYVVTNYRSSTSMFVILSVMMYFYAMFIMPSALLTSKLMRKENLITVIMLSGVAAAALMNFLFIRIGWSGEGVALGTTLSQVVVTLGTLVALMRSAAGDPFRHAGKLAYVSLAFIANSAVFYYLVIREYPLSVVALYSAVTIGMLLIASQHYFKPHPLRLVWDLYRSR